MLIARPGARVWVEEKTLFVFLADVVVHVLCYGELPMQLKSQFGAPEYME